MPEPIVVLYYDEDIANGGFYDCFEYYYILRNCFGPDVIYKCITNYTENDCLAQLEDKYENIDSNIWDGIQFFKHERGKLYNNYRATIVFSAISASLYWFIKHKNILVSDTYMGICDTHDIVPKSEFYNRLNILYDERIFSAAGKFMPYRKKILFDKYKKKDFDGKHDYMFNLALVERRYSKTFLINVINSLPNNSSIAVYIDNKNQEYYSWLYAFNKTDYFKENNNRITVYKPPIYGFMSLFKTFIYIPYTDGHDSTPRLIPECRFYGKNVLMRTEGFKKSGGHYRFEDTQNNFESLWLKEDDTILDIVEESLSSSKN